MGVRGGYGFLTFFFFGGGGGGGVSECDTLAGVEKRRKRDARWEKKVND